MSRRSTDAFTRIYEERVSQVYAFFGYRLGSREDAEDLTQLTFERALSAWDRFDARRATASTWLMAIARNLLVDHYRSGSRERHQPLGPEGVGETALGLESPHESGVGISPDLEEALSRLGKRDRELVALRFGADLSGPEIAELTGLKLANVQQILSRSLRKLRIELDAAESEHISQPALKQLARSA